VSEGGREEPVENCGLGGVIRGGKWGGALVGKHLHTVGSEGVVRRGPYVKPNRIAIRSMYREKKRGSCDAMHLWQTKK